MGEQTTEPEIFITVKRVVNGQRVQTIRQFSLLTFLNARFPGSAIEVEINAMLKEVGHGQ